MLNAFVRLPQQVAWQCEYFQQLSVSKRARYFTMFSQGFVHFGLGFRSRIIIIRFVLFEFSKFDLFWSHLLHPFDLSHWLIHWANECQSHTTLLSSFKCIKPLKELFVSETSQIIKHMPQQIWIYLVKYLWKQMSLFRLC